MLKNRIKTAAVIFIVFVLAQAGCSFWDEKDDAAPAERENNLVIAIPPWDTGIFPSHIVKQVLEQRLDFTVDLKQENNLEAIYAGLADGSIDIYMDAWLPELDKPYMDQYEDQIDDLAVSYKEADIGFVIPAYLADIQTISDLKDNADQFDSNNNGKGDFYGINLDTEIMQTVQEALQIYQLEYEIIETNEDEMVQTVQKAYASKEPIVFIGWRPHWIFSQMDLKFLEDSYNLWKPSEIHVISHKGLKNYAPDAHNFLINWQLPIEDVDAMLYQYRQENKTPDDISQQWINNNQDKLDDWINPNS